MPGAGVCNVILVFLELIVLQEAGERHQKSKYLNGSVMSKCY